MNYPKQPDADAVPIRVLLVDDDEEDYLLTRGMLAEVKLAEYVLDWVPTYEQALRTLEAEEHDVYLVDYRLGDRDGLQLLHEAIDRGCRAPLIMLTGLSDEDLDVKAMRAGAADYLVKGEISPRTLERSIRYAIERKRGEAAILKNEEVLRATIESTADGILVVDEEGRVAYANARFAEMWHIPRDLLATGDDDKLLTFVLDQLKSPEAFLNKVKELYGTANEDLDVLSFKDNRVFERYSLPLMTDGLIGGRVWSFRDITERRELEEQLKHQAFHDSLTGLANRARFADRLEVALLRSARQTKPVAVLFMDLDNFKSVNDGLGHGIGDRLLIEVAGRLSECLRPGDTVARFGGDEFTFLLEDADVDDAVPIAKRTLSDLRAPFLIDNREFFVRASIGIAVSGESRRDAEELVRAADVAMYAAKARGRNRYEVYEQTMHTATVERLELLRDLEQALDRKEFVVHYQPIVSIRTQSVVGFEALVRWQHPRRGIILPTRFISLAEECGVIAPLGRWVLLEACHRASEWYSSGSVGADSIISVNVSAMQLQQPSLVLEVAGALVETGLDPNRLVLEITESTMMHDPAWTANALAEIKRLGVRIAIDDFGTGYSSLSSLRQFPFDILKIDKSFVDSVAEATPEQKLTRTIIDLGKTLNVQVVAEGIERPEQLRTLQSLGCDLGQGFYFARPMSPDDVSEFLKAASGHRISDAA